MRIVGKILRSRRSIAGMSRVGARHLHHQTIQMLIFRPFARSFTVLRARSEKQGVKRLRSAEVYPRLEAK